MANVTKKLQNKALRKNRVRATVSGTAARPRLSVTISNLHVSAQVIDDESGRTLASATTVGAKATGSISDKAAGVGSDIGKKIKGAGITGVVFDRNGRRYAGRLEALATSVRNEGVTL